MKKYHYLKIIKKKKKNKSRTYDGEKSNLSSYIAYYRSWYWKSFDKNHEISRVLENLFWYERIRIQPPHLVVYDSKIDTIHRQQKSCNRK